MSAWQARHGLTAAEYQATFDQLVAAGYRLTDVCGYTDGATVRYTGIWEQKPGPDWQARHGIPVARYQSVFDELRAQGYRPVRLNGYATPSGTQFAGVWIAGPAPDWEARHGMDSATYQAEFNRLRDAGYRLIDVSGYEEGGQARYVAIWERSPGPAWQARHGLDAAAYQAEFDALAANGHILVRVSGYTVSGRTLYAGIWHLRPSRALQARHGIDAETYQRTFDDLLYQGYQLQQVCGYATRNGARFAGVWENEHYDFGALREAEGIARAYMNQFAVPGLSLALSFDGRLIYARALGLADQGAQTPMTVHHRMRIASVSKPITSAAMMRLVQARRVRMTSRVFGARALLGSTFGTQPYSVNERAITLEQLLKHTAGMPTNDGNDPMFQEPTRDHASLIGWVLDNRETLFMPGSSYQYSNFGYCVLGRIIERRTGQTYADFVRNEILTPAGITSMQIAGDTLAARATDEVVYYGQSGDDPYGMRVARMDAHGGWISTAIDLLRFLRVVDGFTPPADRLSAASITTMTTGSAARATYACGWAVDGAGTWDHNGALPGTLSMLRRRADRVGQTVLLNTRQPGAGQNTMMNAMYQMVNDVTTRLGTAASLDLF